MPGLSLQVHFIVAACENMIGGDGLRPGDIITASNGKTIEVREFYHLWLFHDNLLQIALLGVLRDPLVSHVTAVAVIATVVLYNDQLLVSLDVVSFFNFCFHR